MKATTTPFFSHFCARFVPCVQRSSSGILFSNIQPTFSSTSTKHLHLFPTIACSHGERQYAKLAKGKGRVAFTRNEDIFQDDDPLDAILRMYGIDVPSYADVPEWAFQIYWEETKKPEPLLGITPVDRKWWKLKRRQEIKQHNSKCTVKVSGKWKL